jgi:hypothetical protein
MYKPEVVNRAFDTVTEIVKDINSNIQDFASALHAKVMGEKKKEVLLPLTEDQAHNLLTILRKVRNSCDANSDDPKYVKKAFARTFGKYDLVDLQDVINKIVAGICTLE